jgi:PBP1b-binding outer membrane lipoprotein LpoB
MKTYLFVLFSAMVLVGCQSEDTASVDHSTQKPQFGQEQSTIPWNRPEQWENAGALGSMPGVGGQPGIGGPGY